MKSHRMMSNRNPQQSTNRKSTIKEYIFVIYIRTIIKCEGGGPGEVKRVERWGRRWGADGGGGMQAAANSQRSQSSSVRESENMKRMQQTDKLT